MLCRVLGIVLLLTFSICATAGDGVPSTQTRYQVVEGSEKPVASSTVEVVEYFWVGCPHCFAIEPELEAWLGKKAQYVRFVRIPVAWTPKARSHARLYYTLQAIKRLDLMPALFEAIHLNKEPLFDKNEGEARRMHIDFVARRGVPEGEFLRAYNSPAVLADVERAIDSVRRAGVTGVPTFVVAGRYRTTPVLAGGEHEVLSLVDALAAAVYKGTAE